MRFARRHGWIVADPVERLEHDERPRPRASSPARARSRRDRAPARGLRAARPADGCDRALHGLRISEMLGLVWDDIDFAAGVIHVRAQLSRAHRGEPARRVPPKTAASIRDIPLVAQLARLLTAHRQAKPFAAGRLGLYDRPRHSPWPSQRQPARSPTRRPARGAQRRRLAAAALPRPAPHLRQPSHPRPRARRRAREPHPRPPRIRSRSTSTRTSSRTPATRDIRARMAASPLAGLLEPERRRLPAPRCSNSHTGRLALVRSDSDRGLA